MTQLGISACPQLTPPHSIVLRGNNCSNAHLSPLNVKLLDLGMVNLNPRRALHQLLLVRLHRDLRWDNAGRHRRASVLAALSRNFRTLFPTIAHSQNEELEKERKHLSSSDWIRTRLPGNAQAQCARTHTHALQIHPDHSRRAPTLMYFVTRSASGSAAGAAAAPP